jgi:replicative DNA helicase
LTAGRLHAEDFAASEVSATWLAISGLERRGEPVDFVLVAAEVDRQGDTPRFGHGIAAEELARLAARTDIATGYRAADTVAQAALARAAHGARSALQSLGDNRSHEIGEVLHRARRIAANVESVAKRLAGDTTKRAVVTALNPLTAPQSRSAKPGR